MKKLLAFVVAVSCAALVMSAPSAEAKKGRGGTDDPKECEMKRGVLVRK